jgi:hypothetical protein
MGYQDSLVGEYCHGRLGNCSQKEVSNRKIAPSCSTGSGKQEARRTDAASSRKSPLTNPSRFALAEHHPNFALDPGPGCDGVMTGFS